MAVTVPSLSAGLPLPPGRFLVLISVRLSRLQGHIAAGGIRSVEESNDLIGNENDDLTGCSIVPQKICYRLPPKTAIIMINEAVI
jgi:hypothetical protein